MAKLVSSLAPESGMEACKFGKDRNCRRFVVQLAPSLYPPICHTVRMKRKPNRKQETPREKLARFIMQHKQTTILNCLEERKVKGTDVSLQERYPWSSKAGVTSQSCRLIFTISLRAS